ncbi:MAG: LPXTG cell wall anchor domain-containing protein [Clostridia bacterium]|nr:LPXTG cell wall anchor domain-containing protein [Clostridia bacterium]
MNKFAKIASIVMAIALAVSMITFAFAASAATFSLNVVEESDTEVVVSVKLESGSFAAVRFLVEATSDNIGACKEIVPADENAPAASFVETGLSSIIYFMSEYDEAGELFYYTFEKTSADKVTKDDISASIMECSNLAAEEFEAEMVNNLPAAEVPTEPSTEATEPSTEATEPSTEATEPSTEATEPSTEATEPSTEATEPSTEATEPSTEATEPSTEATEPSTEATEPSTEATEPSTEATEPSTEATEPSTEATEPSEDKTDAPVAEDNTTTAPADGDVVNPDTGDSVTATAAIVSLLAVSGAALVALRKKED